MENNEKKKNKNALVILLVVLSLAMILAGVILQLKMNQIEKDNPTSEKPKESVNPSSAPSATPEESTPPTEPERYISVVESVPVIINGVSIDIRNITIQDFLTKTGAMIDWKGEVPYTTKGVTDTIYFELPIAYKNGFLAKGESRDKKELSVEECQFSELEIYEASDDVDNSILGLKYGESTYKDATTVLGEGELMGSNLFFTYRWKLRDSKGDSLGTINIDFKDNNGNPGSIISIKYSI